MAIDRTTAERACAHQSGHLDLTIRRNALRGEPLDLPKAPGVGCLRPMCLEVVLLNKNGTAGLLLMVKFISLFLMVPSFV